MMPKFKKKEVKKKSSLNKKAYTPSLLNLELGDIIMESLYVADYPVLRGLQALL